MLAAILSLVAATTAALITRSVMISNHRQAWINGLRDDLATFFTAIDVVHFESALASQGEQTTKREELYAARNAALLAYRKILMRLNIKEPSHQELEKSLNTLLAPESHLLDDERLSATVTLARTILKQEWEVTKFGPLTPFVLFLKARWRQD